MPDRIDDQIKELLVTDAEKAFRMMIDHYGERLYWHIRRIVLTHDDADDALQNTFMNAWRGAGSFRSESRLLTWLWSIATNEALALIRRREKESHLPLDNLHGILALSEEGAAWFDGDEAEVKLQNALLKLPEKQRLVFNMRYYDELTYDEISAITGTTTGALKASYHHAVKKIEQYLKND